MTRIMIRYYQGIAEGGFGLVITEGIYPNRRTDRDGGSTENRLRLLVVQAVRAAVGPDFLVGIGIS